MRVSELTKGVTNPEDEINILRRRPDSMPAPIIDDLNKNLLVKNHDIFNRSLRPDKKTYPNPITDAAGNIIDKGEAKPELVNRIGLALQKLIIKRAVAFLFGNPVIKNYNAKDDTDENLVKCIIEYLDDNNEDMLNRMAARSVFSYKEVAEYWFVTKEEEAHEDYGFSTNFKLKCITFSPKNGDILYPIFNEYGTLVAFSREFTIKHKDFTESYFETFTDEETIRWKSSSITNKWERFGKSETNIIKKIPIIYGYQEDGETDDVNDIISRLETLFSNLGDVNDHHTAPKIFINGRVVSFGQKGQSNTIIQGEKDAKAEYLSWDHAPESFKVEVENLLKMLYTISQTPDISFDSVKGLGSISGVALKLLFMDAHLKVKDKEEIFLPFLKRRYSILKAYALQMNTKFKSSTSLRIKPQIDPFMIADDLTLAKVIQIANGSKPFISQQDSVKQWGGTNEDYIKIMEERKTELQEDLFEPTI